MGVFQRTTTTLVNKAGKTLVDLVLNANSNEPIANSAVTAKFNEINNDLSANSNHFYFDYQNGKYGYNTDPSRGAGTFSPFNKTPELSQVSESISGTTASRTLLECDTTNIYLSFSGWSNYGVFSTLYVDNQIVKQGTQGTTASDAWTYFNNFNSTVHVKMVANLGQHNGSCSLVGTYVLS